MIPQNNAAFEYSELSEQPTRTYAIDFNTGTAAGFTDGLSAMKQAVFLILSTERFRHLIFSWNYGAELDGVIGQDRALAESEIKRRITEALLLDERITAVDGFSFSQTTRRALEVSFSVTTVFGAFEKKTEVQL